MNTNDNYLSSKIENGHMIITVNNDNASRIKCTNSSQNPMSVTIDIDGKPLYCANNQTSKHTDTKSFGITPRTNSDFLSDFSSVNMSNKKSITDLPPYIYKFFIDRIPKKDNPEDRIEGSPHKTVNGGFSIHRYSSNSSSYIINKNNYSAITKLNVTN